MLIQLPVVPNGSTTSHCGDEWVVGFQKYLESYEVRLHLRRDTYGGKVWELQLPNGRISLSRQMEIAALALNQKYLGRAVS